MALKDKKAHPAITFSIAPSPDLPTSRGEMIADSNNDVVSRRRFIGFHRTKVFLVVLFFSISEVILQLLDIITSSSSFRSLFVVMERTPSNAKQHTIYSTYHDYDTIFYARDSTARSACTNLDNVVLNQRQQKQLQQESFKTNNNNNNNNNSTRHKQLFAECMDALAQTQFHTTTTNAPCIEKAESSSSSSAVVYIHVFWANGELPATAELGLLSILHSQKKDQYDCRRTDDLSFQVIVWTLYPKTQAILKQQLRKYNPSIGNKNTTTNNTTNELVVSVQLLNATNLMQRMMTNFPDLTESILSAKRLLYGLFVYQENRLGLTPLSDVVRVLVLAAYGGIYLDLDVLVLRSFRPLLGHDFYYRWSTQDYCNTAVMGLQKKSRNTAALLKASLGRVDRLEDLAKLYHPQALYKLAQSGNASIELLPSAYFDPLWVVEDVYDDESKQAVKEQYGLSGFVSWFKEKRPVTTCTQPIEFFPGAFTFHWHNQWNEPIVNGTIPWMFLKYYESQDAAVRIERL